MKLGSPLMAKFTSKKKKAVASIIAHTIIKRQKAGKNPPKDVMTGRASIPAPVAVPAMSRTPPNKGLFCFKRT